MCLVIVALWGPTLQAAMLRIELSPLILPTLIEGQSARITLNPNGQVVGDGLRSDTRFSQVAAGQIRLSGLSIGSVIELRPSINMSTLRVERWLLQPQDDHGATLCRVSPSVFWLSVTQPTLELALGLTVQVAPSHRFDLSPTLTLEGRTVALIPSGHPCQILKK